MHLILNVHHLGQRVRKMSAGCVGCQGEIELPFKFRMAFQPIVDLNAQRVWGYEALVRGVNGESACFGKSGTSISVIRGQGFQ